MRECRQVAARRPRPVVALLLSPETGALQSAVNGNILGVGAIIVRWCVAAVSVMRYRGCIGWMDALWRVHAPRCWALP